MMRAFWIVFAAAAAACPARAAPADGPPSPPFEYGNPIDFRYEADRDEVRDPCVVREGGTYFLVFTMYPFTNREVGRLGLPDAGSSPGIRIYSSTDLRHWAAGNWLVKSSDLPVDCPYKHRFWAPEIHKVGGRFYLIFTADNWLKDAYNPAGKIGVAGYAFVGVADQIGGPYRHVTYVPGGACDTTLLEAADGKTYAVMPFGDMFIQPIDLSGIDHDRVTLTGERKRIVTADNADIGRASHPAYVEGPWVERVGSRYVLFFGELYNDKAFPADVGYWTGAAYADQPMGPWTKDPRGRVFWGGHLAVFDGPAGRRWFSYRGEAPGATHGRLCIDPLAFRPDGIVQTAGPTVGPTSVSEAAR